MLPYIWHTWILWAYVRKAPDFRHQMDQEGIAKSSGKVSMADRELMLRQASLRIPSQLVSIAMVCHGMSWYVMVIHRKSPGLDVSPSPRP